MISKAQRQAIIADFARRHGGVYDPTKFVREVQKVGEKHPAFDWFVWDDDAAANEFRIWQARVFAQGLVIRFKIEEVGRGGSIKIVESEMPMLLSPMSGRQDGGGYVVVNPHDEEHRAMLCGEAAVALQSWLRRYTAAVRSTGTPERIVTHLIEALQRAAGEGVEEAAE